jgi:dUTPase
MKVLYATDKTGELAVVNDVFVFTCNKPTEIQPGEIKKVPTGVVLTVDRGYVVNVTTHPALAEKVGQLFPACVTLTYDEPEEYLTFAVHNGGRNPFRLMPGDPIARGFAAPIEPVEKDTYTPKVQEPVKMERSTPQRRNADIQFEVK